MPVETSVKNGGGPVVNGFTSPGPSQGVQRCGRDWQAVYGHDLALAETFVEKDRFAGTAYAAANWICVGQTLGRGRNDRTHDHDGPIKTIWLRPLQADFRPFLCQER